MTTSHVKQTFHLPFLTFLLLTFLTNTNSAFAHKDGAYSHESSIGYTNQDWMSGIPNDTHLSELSIPGTHDTMAYKISNLAPLFDCQLLSDLTLTQSMNLKTQLESGIRFLDIRGFLTKDRLQMHHGVCDLDSDFDEVLDTVLEFLEDHPSETILMKVAQENGDNEENNIFSWLDVFDWYLSDSKFNSHIWTPPWTPYDPELSELRGKIVFIQKFPNGSYSNNVAFNSSDFKPYSQDDYGLTCHSELYSKWLAVKGQLGKASTTFDNNLYFNYLSGSYSGDAAWTFATLTACVVEPYFVASGHKAPATDADRKDTKEDDSYPATYQKYPDFPRIGCQDGSKVLQKAKCDIEYEGTNILTADWLLSQTTQQRVGVIVADFPGKDLIEQVIRMNSLPGNQKPIADAGGPYIFDEGVIFELDASGSTDKEGDPLVYQWDYDSDGVPDTNWSSLAKIQAPFIDDWSGKVTVGVSDRPSDPDSRASYATVDVVIANVDPSIDSFDTTNRYSYAEGETAVIRGKFSDPALGLSTETFTGIASWSDEPGVWRDVTLDDDGTFETSRELFNVLGMGELSKELTIDVVIYDDDGGRGAAISPQIEVSHAPPTIDTVQMPRTIQEGDTIVVTGTFSDPVYEACDTRTYYEGTALWSDGIWSDLTANLDGTFETSRTFADEWMFSGREDTSEADYNVTITIYDFCRNRAYRTSPTLTVENVSPRIASRYIDKSRLAEGETVTISGTFSDPALGTHFESYTGRTLWSDDVHTDVTIDNDAGTFETSRRFGDVGSVPEEFTMQIVLFDDDGGRSDIVTSPTITVENAPPVVDEVSAPDHPIFEGHEATIYGRYHDPSGPDSNETIRGTALWSDGQRTDVQFFGPVFKVARTFLDDDPTGTPFDDYTMEITIRDSDGGISDPVTAAVTIRNSDPIASIDSLTDETGATVGTGVRNVLVNTRLDLQGSFTDVGTRDTHTATVKWGDGNTNSGRTTGTVSVPHVYRTTGAYPVTLGVTDDDTGVSTTSTPITVVDSAQAITAISSDLSGGTQTLGAIATTEIQLAGAQLSTSEQSVSGGADEAVAKLSGPGGALQMLAQGNLNAALVKMWQAMRSLQATASTLDLTPYKTLLALSAKSTAVTAILQAETEAATGEDANKTAEANALIAAGDSKLAGGNFVQAVDLYGRAARRVQGIVN